MVVKNMGTVGIRLKEPYVVMPLPGPVKEYPGFRFAEAYEPRKIYSPSLAMFFKRVDELL